MSSRFEKISCLRDGNLIGQLEEELLSRLPDSVHILVLLKLWRKQKFPKKVDVQLYIYKGSDNEKEDVGEKDNPFIICIQRPNIYSKKAIILLTPRSPTQKQIETFESFIGWDEPMNFQCAPQPIWDAILKLCKSHGKLNPENGEKLQCQFYAFMNLEKAKNLAIETPSSLVVRPLETSESSLIVEGKEWASPHSEEVIQQCIETLGSCGVFENGEMASSVLLSPLGLCNALYTPNKFRNRGLGKLVMKYITRETSTRMGTFPLVEAEVWNTPSKRVMTSVGYEEMYLTKWFFYEPS